LAVATAFKRLPNAPKRSVLFAFWDGEEEGLLGSKNWVEHPTIPLARVAAMINIDMIGRLRGDRVEVFAWRTARGLRRLVSEQNSGVDLLLDFEMELKSNSDHHSFYSRHVPTVFFHTGLHNDYHRPSDDVEKINAAGLGKTATLIFKTAYELAERTPLAGFRATALSEAQSSLEAIESSRAATPPGRAGITWDEKQKGVVVQQIRPNRIANRRPDRRGRRSGAGVGRRIPRHRAGRR
jgi:hypothetical protein